MSGEAYHNADWLSEKYHGEGLTGKEMAEEAGCSRTTIYKYMREHDIERDRGEGYRVSTDEKYRDAEWLQSKYHGERLSTSEIGEICDCTKQTIKLWLEKHGIDKRSRSEAAKVRLENNPELKKGLIEAGTKALKECDTNAWDLWTEEEREAFRQRLSEERTGEGNPMWNVTGRDHPNFKPNKAPKHFYQSKAWKEARQEALDRDGHECQACGQTDGLHVHHITPVSAGGPRYELNNLVTLCDTHHREWEGLYLRPDNRG